MPSLLLLWVLLRTAMQVSVILLALMAILGILLQGT